MIAEFVTAAVVVNVGRSLHWLWIDHKRSKQNHKQLSESLMNAKTWDEWERNTEEFRAAHPEVFERPPKPLMLRAAERYVDWRNGE